MLPDRGWRQTYKGQKTPDKMIQKRFVQAVGLGVLVVALFLIIGACAKNSSLPPKVSYSSDLKELRDRFNNDKGKVRLLLILSPT